MRQSFQPLQNLHKVYFTKFPKKKTRRQKPLSKKSLKVNCNKKTLTTNESETVISAKANFLITLLHRKPRSKGEREGGRGRGTRLISGLRFFYRGRVRLKQAGPFCHLLRSITTVLLSTAATIRIVCQRPINVASKISGRKKSWLEERGDGGPPFFFQLAKRKQITPPPLHSSSPFVRSQSDYPARRIFAPFFRFRQPTFFFIGRSF